MKKKALFLVAVVIIAVLGYLYTRPAMPVLSMDKIYDVATVGDTVLINASISNLPPCTSIRTRVVWDPAIIRLSTGGPNSTRPAAGGDRVNIYEGPFMKRQGGTIFVINSADNDEGFVDLGVVSRAAGGVRGSGVVFIFNFTIVSLGTTTLEMRPPTAMFNQSIVVDTANHLIAHVEDYGLITEDDPPPVWLSANFQNIILGEVALLALATTVIYWRTHPRPTRAERRRAELKPIIAPEDQKDSN